MTGPLLVVFFAAAWIVIGTAVLMAWDMLHAPVRAAAALRAHEDEAIALTRPIGPEDDAQWLAAL